MRTSRKKQHRLFLVPSAMVAPTDRNNLPSEDLCAEFVQAPFDFDAVPDEEEKPCVHS
jgi:hypothetical protein